MKKEIGFWCEATGAWYFGVPDCGYQRPDDLLRLTAARRARCKESDDACVIVPPRGKRGPRRFYIRGVLYAPLTDNPGEAFGWGVWVRIRKADFDRVMELWDEDGSGEPPLTGRLANHVAGFARSRGCAVLMKLGDQNTRPSVEIVDRKHPLGQIQRDGLSTHDAFEYAKFFNRS